MFICTPCRRESHLDERLFKSHGRCEVCGWNDVCDDYPSYQIPKDKVLKSGRS